MKCPYCRRRFRPRKDKSYACFDTPKQASYEGLLLAFTATDCPHCGAQLLLGRRYPKVNEISDLLIRRLPGEG